MKKKKKLPIILFNLIVLVAVFFASYHTFKYLEKDETVAPVETPGIDISQKETNDLDVVVSNLVEDFYKQYGNVPELSLYIKNLKTDEWSLYNDKQMNSASVIKLFIAMTAYEKDGLNIEESLKQDLAKMITESNNESTNNLIDKYTFAGINRAIYRNGYRQTELRRKVYNTLPPGGPSGEDNLCSTKEAGIFLENVWKGTMVNKSCSDAMLELLKKQERVNKIPANLKDQGVVVYNKTGELSSVENDVAIITGVDKNGESFEFVFCVFVNDIPNNETKTAFKKNVQETIADMALEAVTYFKDPAEYMK